MLDGITDILSCRRLFRPSLENAEEGYVLSRNARVVMCLTKNSSETRQQVLVYEGLGPLGSTKGPDLR